MGYSMYAYAGNGGLTRKIIVTSIGNNQSEINQQTTSVPGSVSALSTAFSNTRKPAPMNFTWKPDSAIPAALFGRLFNSGEFALELRVIDSSSRNAIELNFYRCKLLRYRSIGSGGIRIEATYMSFQ